MMYARGVTSFDTPRPKINVRGSCMYYDNQLDVLNAKNCSHFSRVICFLNKNRKIRFQIEKIDFKVNFKKISQMANILGQTLLVIKLKKQNH